MRRALAGEYRRTSTRPGFAGAWFVLVVGCLIALAPTAWAQSEAPEAALESASAVDTAAEAAAEELARETAAAEAAAQQEAAEALRAEAQREAEAQAEAERTLWNYEAGVGLETNASAMRVEPARQVPLSLRIYDDLEIQSRQIRRIDEIGMGAANVEIDAVPGSTRDSRIYIRGLGMDNPTSNVDPSVGLYVDGVYVPRATNALIDVVDVERIEILRGVQGTRYGKNLTGGAIYVRSQRPGREFGVMGDLSAGALGLFQGDAAVDVPITSGWFEDRLFTRWTVSARTSDGQATNRFDGGESGQNNLLGGRLAMELLATDDLSFDLVFGAFNQKERDLVGKCALGAGNVYSRYLTDNFNGAVGSRFPDECAEASTFANNVGFADPLTRHTTNTITTSFGARYDLGRFTSSFADRFEVRSTTGFWYRDDTITAGDGDGTSIDFRANDGGDEWHWTISEDLSLNMAFLDDRVDVLLGAFIMKEKSEQNDESNVLRDFALGADSIFMVTPETYPNGPTVTDNAIADAQINPSWTPGNAPLVLVNWFNNNNAAVLRQSQLFGVGAQNYTREQDWSHTQYAGYAHVDVEVLERLSVDGGVRYTHEEKERGGSEQGTFCQGVRYTGIVFPLVSVPVVPNADGSCGANRSRARTVEEQSDTFSAVTGDAALRYEIDGGMLFFRYARGFKSGGFTAETLDTNLITQLDDRGNDFDTRYDSESMDTYEFGVKTSFFEDELFLNSSIFWNEIDDLQVSSVESDGLGFTRTQINNAEEASIRGFEVEAAWVPTFEWLPGNASQLAITGGLGVTDANYDTYDITSPTPFVNASQCTSLVRGSTGCPPLPGPPDVASPTLTQLPIDQVAIYNAMTMIGFLPVPTQTRDASSLAFANVPKINVNGSFNYAFNPVSEATLGLRFDYAYRSSIQYGSGGDALLRDGQLHVMNLLLSLDILSTNSSIALWVKNLSDQEALTGGVGSSAVLGSEQLYYTAPRTFGINLRQTF